MHIKLSICDLGCQAGRCHADPNPSTVFAQVEESSQFFLHVAVSEQDKARSNQAHYEYYTAARYANVCVSIAFDTHNHGSADTLLALLPAPFSALETHTIASASMSRPSASPRSSQSMQGGVCYVCQLVRSACAAIALPQSHKPCLRQLQNRCTVHT